MYSSVILLSSLATVFVVADTVDNSTTLDISKILLNLIDHINQTELIKIKNMINEMKLDQINPHVENVTVIIIFVMVSVLFVFKMYKKICRVIKSTDRRNT